ncbi:LSU ribosomal protein L4p (L1e) [hydrothermal vent metagenome]|uniref:LSU ribosomal protein L4p (L1e) n=1 Tax=hydrothermal vent metagenome TaxID=652676 RepID=A0A3B1D1Y4_9ZZZZ
MISLPVYNISGEEVGSYELDSADLAPGINKQLLHDVVVMHEANRRVGTVRTKSRGEVRGSTAKLFRQKGTGRARAGSSRTPVRRGGGHTFAKKPIDYSYRLPRKAVQLATRMALLSKFTDEEAKVLDSLSVETPKTSLIIGMLKSLNLAGKTCLLVIEEYDQVIWKSARNITGLKVSPVSDLNTYDLLRQRNLLITKGAIDIARSAKNNTEEAVAAG